MFTKSRIRCAIAAVAFFFPFAAFADKLPEPEGRVVLEVVGNISNTTDGKVAKLDMKTLEGLGLKKITTDTPWYNYTAEFEGPTLGAVLEYVGAKGDVVEAVALNDYQVEIPVSDVAEWDPILATRHMGEHMSVREKGPIFVIYPYDDHKDLRHHIYYARSIWQVYRIIVR